MPYNPYDRGAPYAEAGNAIAQLLNAWNERKKREADMWFQALRGAQSKEEAEQILAGANPGVMKNLQRCQDEWGNRIPPDQVGSAVLTHTFQLCRIVIGNASEVNAPTAASGSSRSGRRPDWFGLTPHVRQIPTGG